MKQRGFFISLEGGEGVGKSTAIETIASYLSEQGHDYLVTREPGGTPAAEKMRQMVLEDQVETLTPLAELLLVFAARAQHVATVIRPALENGKVVVCDRFTDASFAYQGAGRGVDEKHITYLADLTHPTLWPDVTLLFDAPAKLGNERIAKRGNHDRIEQEDLAFFERVHQAYRQRAVAAPARFSLVDASLPLETVQAHVLAVLKQAMTSW